MSNYFEELDRLNNKLLVNIKTNLKELEELWIKVNDHWNYEDGIYRFYHCSFKVFYIQDITVQIVNLLKKLAPKNVTFNEMFEEIFKEGTGKKFKSSYDKNWSKHIRPLLEAFFHAKFFLEMAIKYGKELENAPTYLTSGWAAVLYFYNLR
jgi:hypothetical protein